MQTFLISFDLIQIISNNGSQPTLRVLLVERKITVFQVVREKLPFFQKA